MASNEGDIVLDPFVGGGTTVAVADKLNRQWIGIDQSPMAVKVLVKVDDIIPIAVKPVLGVHINEMEKDDKGSRRLP